MSSKFVFLIPKSWHPISTSSLLSVWGEIRPHFWRYRVNSNLGHMHGPKYGKRTLCLWQTKVVADHLTTESPQLHRLDHWGRGRGIKISWLQVWIIVRLLDWHFYCYPDGMRQMILSPVHAISIKSIPAVEFVIYNVIWITKIIATGVNRSLQHKVHFVLVMIRWASGVKCRNENYNAV